MVFSNLGVVKYELEQTSCEDAGSGIYLDEITDNILLGDQDQDRSRSPGNIGQGSVAVRSTPLLHQQRLVRIKCRVLTVVTAVSIE